jgi:Nucleotidyltransferase of unknown function (DUF6036)
MSREVVLELLHELAARLHTRGISAGIHLVGGAALAIAYYDRRATFVIDAVFSPRKQVLDVVAELAAERNLPPDWLNNNAKGYVPFVGPEAWVEVFSEGEVTVSVGRPEMLLAMKLAANRGRRDGDDIAALLDICEITSVDQAQEVYETYQAQGVLSAAATARIEAHLAHRP